MLWLAVVAAGKTTWTSEDLARISLVERLYKEEAVSLVRLARLFTDDRTGAEDIVQEAFIRLYHANERILDPAKSAAYLRSIVLNLARDHNRRGLLSLRHQDSMIDDRVSEDPGQRIVQDESKAAVIDALNSLSRRQRDCLVLRFYFDLTEREIAETLSISVNSVKTHCRRGLATMAPILEGR
ncbi:MAG TPA: SigE family RNA polymerase sigma factor [Acidimicrobiia bacterium]|nr:SigE family RNA polymerase sigma factor [Acidimicrobiia bacterium]